MVASRPHRCLQKQRKNDKANSKTESLKGLECLGADAYETIRRMMRVQLGAGRRKGLPEGYPDNPDDAVSAFLSKKGATLGKKLKEFNKDEKGKVICDQKFEKYFSTAIKNFLDDCYAGTPDGHLREVMRKHLERDKRCERSKRDGQCWKHVECPDRDTTASTAYLINKAREYPFKFTPADPYPADPKKGTRPQYGGRGELDNMLVGVLLAADGWTRTAVLLDVFKSRLPMEAKTLTYYKGDISEEDRHIEASVAQHSPNIDQLLLEVDEHRDDWEWIEGVLLELSMFPGGFRGDLDEYWNELTERKS